MAGRRCTICHHKKSEAINKEIAYGEASLRNIAKQFNLKSHVNVYRHAQDCLGTPVGALIIKKQDENRIDAMKELQAQFEIAKQLRAAAVEYLIDPENPLKFTLDPFAHEVSIQSFDYTDLSERGTPKKKRNDLSTLLAMLRLGPAQEHDDEMMRAAVFAELESKDLDDTTEIFDLVWDKARRYFMHIRQSLDREVEKVSIKHADIRTLIATYLDKTESIIDKCLKIEGLYKEDAPNDPKAKAVDAIRALMIMRPELNEKQAMEAILEQQRQRNVILIEPSIMRQVARDNGIMELEGIQ